MGKVILVTGATSGIGLACADRLASMGHRVYGVGRRVPESGQTAPGGWQMLQCDITNQESVDRCVSRILEEAGRIDVLINCAGFGLGGAVEDCTTEEVKAQFETNFFGTHRMIRAVMPVMRRQGGGMILNMSSVAAEFVIPYQSFYSISKMAMDGLTTAVRMEGKPFGIIAASINPGDVNSGFTAARMQAAALTPESPYYRMAMKSIETMKRDEMNGMAPERVAELVVRLINRRTLKPQYFIEPQYKATVFLKRLLPKSAVEFLLSKMY